MRTYATVVHVLALCMHANHMYFSHHQWAIYMLSNYTCLAIYETRQLMSFEHVNGDITLIMPEMLSKVFISSLKRAYNSRLDSQLNCSLRQGQPIGNPADLLGIIK